MMNHFINLLTLFGIISCTQAQLPGKLLKAAEFNKTITGCSKPIILDVRTSKEFSQGNIKNAINFDWNGSDFKEKSATINKKDTLFVYCHSGGRSHSAAEYFRESGYKNVYELDGGIMSWRAAKLPEVKK